MAIWTSANLVLTMQLAIVFLGSLLLASLLNHGIYRFAWNRRPIGPWSKAHPDAPPRRWSDYLPVFGWFGLEREAKIHGRWFWIRPMLIELLFAMSICLLFQFEIDGGLHPGERFDTALSREIQCEFLSHVLLFALMLVATFIDLDEKTIPDAITVTGTIIGLGLATVWPASLLPDGPQTLWLTAPNGWSPGLDSGRGLAYGLAAIAGWCIALPHRTIYFRRGPIKGVQFLIASILPRTGNYWGIRVVGNRLVFRICRLAMVGWSSLARFVDQFGWTGRRRCGRLGDSCRGIRGASKRGVGIRRCDTDGHDRKLPRLATLRPCFFHGTIRRSGHCRFSISRDATSRYRLRTVFVPCGRRSCGYLASPLVAMVFRIRDGLDPARNLAGLVCTDGLDARGLSLGH